MKKYRMKYGCTFYFNFHFSSYTIDAYYHGYYFFIKDNNIFIKGYFNKGSQYSHWLYKNKLRYYL